MKECSTCNTAKADSEFRKDALTKDGLQFQCKLCASAREKSLYYTRYKPEVDKRNRERAERNKTIVQEAKLANPCLFCKEAEPIALAFHHVDPTQKDFELSNARGMSSQRVINEIAKCVVLCHNCHAKVHAGLLTL